ncbi:MAG TPA: hypothetical protein ENK46_06180 [Flavobacteriia bacterium]|nr:hypothetical protein [Flavobacteriia bacterium]
MNKTLFLIFSSIILCCFSSSAQNITLDEPELIQVLCKQWKIDFAVVGNMKIGQKPGADNFDMKFASDGTYRLINDNEKTINTGKWTYNVKKKYVELSIDEKVTSRILSINAKKLVLILVSGKNDPPGLPQMEVHFKPAQ